MTDIDITHQFNEATNRRIGNVLIIIGIMLWTWLPYSLWEKKQFADNAAIVTGRIISNQGAPEVMFVLKTGETMKAKMYGWRPRDLKQGDVVEIVYSLKDPQKIELESNLGLGNWSSRFLR
jgi:hypothetical protein